jgi:hypothetical protein
MTSDHFWDAVDTVKATLIDTAKETFPTNAVVPTPQVWAFDSRSDKPLTGYAVCRDYTRGPDALLAISSLGILADALRAELVVLIWEEADLRTSLYGPSDHHPNGMVVLEASRDSHELTWYPFDFTVIGYNPNGLPRLDVRWGKSVHTAGAPLPEVITLLLDEWRSGQITSHEEAQAMIIGAENDGYGIRGSGLSHDRCLLVSECEFACSSGSLALR